MLKNFALAFYYFYFLDCLYSFFPFLFAKEKQIAFSTLRSNISYRLPESSKTDWLIPARIFWRILLNGLNQVKPQAAASDEAIFDTGTASFQLRQNYLKLFYPDKQFHGIAKDSVINITSTAFKIGLVMILSCITPVAVFFNFFRKNKLRAGLKIIQFAEACALLNYCSKFKINKLYYFTIYEPDSNLCSLMLQQCNVWVVLVTSEVPLRFGNMKMTASEINFCFGYQLEEFEHYKQNCVVKETRLLIPETVHETAPYYIKNNFFETPEGTIGFISSGMWLRKIMGDADSGFNELANETKILEWLVDYSKYNPRSKLVIYLHPIEKRSEYLELTKKHYLELLNGEQPRFAPFSTKSSLGFNNSEICVALYSTLIYERLFMGFKSIIAPLDIDDFPIQNSSLYKCSAKSKEELFKRLDQFLSMSSSSFIDYIGFGKQYYKNFSQLF